jgi:hypothetical protein
MIVVVGFAVTELWLLILYVVECGSTRERVLTVTTFGLAGLWGLACLLGVLGAVDRVRSAADRMMALNHLKVIGKAMHDYHDNKQSLPPGRASDRSRAVRAGAAVVSWRVLLLPYLGHEDLHAKYRMDEPWDGPNNIQLLPLMPGVYGLPSTAAATQQGHTYFRVFVAAPRAKLRTAFEDGYGVSRNSFLDGTSNTILVVEAAEAVPWTKPDELVYDPNQPLPELGGHFREVILALFADGSVRTIPKQIEEGRLRALITRNGDERVTDW